jgi:hypothetical protein
VPTEELEDVHLLLLNEPGREMFGDELGCWIEAKWEQKRMGSQRVRQES